MAVMVARTKRLNNLCCTYKARENPSDKSLYAMAVEESQTPLVSRGSGPLNPKKQSCQNL